MSKKVYLFSFVLLTLFFVSCSETEEAGRYDNWQTRNEAYIDSLTNVFETAPDKGGLSRIRVQSGTSSDFLYYKVKTAITTDEQNDELAGRQPTSNATVKVYYKGTNILGEYFDGNFSGKDPVAGDPNANVGDSTPALMPLSSMITGWIEALQVMKIGDRWEIFIPAKYAYGSTDKSTQIPAYSTLIFDIQLLDSDAVSEIAGN